MNEQRLDAYLGRVVFDLLDAIRLANITAPGSEQALLAKLNDILDQYGRTLEQVVPRNIVLEYFDGVDEANAALSASGAIAGAATAKAVQNGMIISEYRRLIHLEAVENIIDDAMMDIGQAIATTRAAAIETVLTVVDEIREELAAGLIRGDSQNVTTHRLMQRFLDNGLTAFLVEDKNGMIRSLPLHHYARTVVRSKTRNAHVQGSIRRYRETAGGFIRIVGNGDSCAQCSQYRNLIVSLGDPVPGITPYTEGNLPLPPYHPSCRCGVISYDPGLAAEEELAAVSEAFEQYEPGKDRRTPAEKAAYEREQAGRRRANENMKQYARWQSALGAEAPKTFGAFQRMKRQNTVRFQQLQSEYRTFAQLNRKT